VPLDHHKSLALQAVHALNILCRPFT
jgi:hypothetical protein